MKLRKVLAIGLVLSMALALASCSSYSKNKSKAIKAFKKLGYDKEDQDFMDELQESTEDGDIVDVDGFYLEAENMKPLNTFFDNIDSFKAKNVKSCLMGGESMGVKNVKDEDNECSWQYYLIEFVDEDKAKEFFDDYADSMDEHYDQFKGQFEQVKDYLDVYELEFDDDKTRAQFYLLMTSEELDGFMTASMDIILDGDTVTYIVAASPDKKAFKKISGDYEEFYEELGLETPKDALT